MNPQDQAARTRALAAVGALVAVLIVIVIMVANALSHAKPEPALTTFLAAWSAGEYQSAAALTDGDPQQVARALEANVEGLDGATLDPEVQEVTQEDEQTGARVRMTWSVPEIGEFSYSTSRIRLVESGDEWLIRWNERVVHPRLERGERLGTVEEQPARAPIIDREGRELVTVQPVVEIGVVPGDLEDTDAAVAAIAEATEADAETLEGSIEAADPESFVPAITVRQEEFQAIEGDLSGIPGLEFGDRELPLAPTREFARAVLGTVGPVTAEQLEESEGGLEVGELVGQFGLQAAFEDRLAGTPERSIVIRNSEGDVVDTLDTVEGEDGEPLATTLDRRAQRVAERALSDVDAKAALVAIEPSSGDILAVANRPTDDSFNRAMAGQYPPGSTFKVISTAALLAAGLDPEETVDCPETFNVGGRDFVNFEGAAAGAVPFSTDFAQSCNTAFVSLADRLKPTALRRTARAFGFGHDYDLALESFSGKAPPGRDEVERAAAMIGQARILASPLAMAGVAATVVAGRWHLPRLLADDPSDEGPELPTDDVEILRTLMRSVITLGTGTALASVLGEPIGKSGTAEVGSGDPPPTHAWFIAGREDVAVAVLVEDGTSGGEVAAPIAAEFLSGLG